MTHTPSPWTLAEANSTIPVKGANGRTVASVRYGATDYDDARLIAAAPDLLAALRPLVAIVNGANVPKSKCEQYLDEARAAIAKATA